MAEEKNMKDVFEEGVAPAGDIEEAAVEQERQGSEAAAGSEASCKDAEKEASCKDAEKETSYDDAEKEAGGSEAESAAENEPEKAAPEETEEPLKQQYLRLMADFQNYKRRTENDRSRIYAEANERLVSELLPVLDNFERALSTEGAGEGYAKGMELIFVQLKDVLKKSGLAEIEAEGKSFDPNFHQAIGKVDKEGAESDSVVDVLQKGYTLNGKVLRPATVRIAN